MTAGAPGPRLFGLPAVAAPVVAVVRRGPSAWSRLGCWHVAEHRWEPGAWLHGRIFPQRCDLSPDGRWFLACIHKPGADWPAGDVYEAVSRAPWLTALAAWGEGSTYARGAHLTEATGVCELGSPDVGDAGPLLARHGLAVTLAEQFAVERRRGWAEVPGTPPRAERGPWDDRVGIEVRRPHPDDAGTWLHATGLAAGHRTGLFEDDPATYWLEAHGELVVLDDVQWADWAHDGSLLVATVDGRLQQRRPDGGRDADAVEIDLAPERPEPTPPPAWASEW